MPDTLVHEADYWTPLRVRMRVFLEELEAIAEGTAYRARPGCPSMTDFRAAVEVIDRYIDAMPLDCDCHDQP